MQHPRQGHIRHPGRAAGDDGRHPRVGAGLADNAVLGDGDHRWRAQYHQTHALKGTGDGKGYLELRLADEVGIADCPRPRGYEPVARGQLLTSCAEDCRGSLEQFLIRVGRGLLNVERGSPKRRVGVHAHAAHQVDLNHLVQHPSRDTPVGCQIGVASKQVGDRLKGQPELLSDDLAHAGCNRALTNVAHADPDRHGVVWLDPDPGGEKAGFGGSRGPFDHQTMPSPARTTARMIAAYVPQRQRWGLGVVNACLIWAKDGLGTRLSRSTAASIIPHWQYPHCGTCSSIQACCTGCKAPG